MDALSAADGESDPPPPSVCSPQALAGSGDAHPRRGGPCALLIRTLRDGSLRKSPRCRTQSSCFASSPGMQRPRPADTESRGLVPHVSPSCALPVDEQAGLCRARIGPLSWLSFFTHSVCAPSDSSVTWLPVFLVLFAASDEFA